MQSAKMHLIKKWASLIFQIIFLTICGTLKNGPQRPIFDVWEAEMDPGANLRTREAHFGKASVVCVCGAICVC